MTSSSNAPSRTNRRAIIRTIGCVAIASLFGSVASGQNQARQGAGVTLNDGLPREAQGVTVDQKLGERIPSGLPLTDSTGKRIETGYIFNGRLPTILTLNYSDCPMLCSVQLNGLVKSLSELDLKIGQDFQILTVSIDPKESTRKAAETKARYLDDLKNQNYADKGWIFATAKQPIITKLTDVVGFRYRYDRTIKQYNHPAMLAFVSPDGVISRYSLSIDFPPEQLKLALVEAGDGKVGSAVDQFILWCYSYDPSSNSYTPHAWRIMRLCGLGFIGLMMATLLPYWIGRKGSPNSSSVEGEGRSDAGDLSNNNIPEQPETA